MIRPFGTLADGQRVDAITLGARGLQVELLTYGAILHRVSYPVRGQRRDLILFLGGLDDYVRDRAYVGPLVGRFGNRIAQSRFRLDGRESRVTANEGVNHLHGGALGFGKRLWRVLSQDQSRMPTLELGLLSPAGEEGYPGSLDATVTLVALPGSLRITQRDGLDAAAILELPERPHRNLSTCASAVPAPRSPSETPIPR